MGQPSRTWLPVTLEILLKIHQQWREWDTEWDIIMLWTTICLCFYGFLRVGEAVAPNYGGIDLSQHLAFDDIAVDSIDNPSFTRGVWNQWNGILEWNGGMEHWNGITKWFFQ